MEAHADEQHKTACNRGCGRAVYVSAEAWALGLRSATCPACEAAYEREHAAEREHAREVSAAAADERQAKRNRRKQRRIREARQRAEEVRREPTQYGTYWWQD